MPITICCWVIISDFGTQWFFKICGYKNYPSWPCLVYSQHMQLYHRHNSWCGPSRSIFWMRWTLNSALLLMQLVVVVEKSNFTSSYMMHYVDHLYYVCCDNLIAFLSSVVCMCRYRESCDALLQSSCWSGDEHISFLNCSSLPSQNISELCTAVELKKATG